MREIHGVNRQVGTGSKIQLMDHGLNRRFVPSVTDPKFTDYKHVHFRTLPGVLPAAKLVICVLPIQRPIARRYPDFIREIFTRRSDRRAPAISGVPRFRCRRCFVAWGGGPLRYPDPNWQIEILASQQNSCDLVTMTELVEHTPEPVQFLKGVNRILKRGGHALVNVS